MCGRFGASYRDIKTVWNLHGDFSFQTRYNIAPSQEVPVIIRNDGHNEAKLMQWGLVPSWAPETNRIRLADRAKPKCWIMPTISAGRTPLTKMKALGRWIGIRKLSLRSRRGRTWPAEWATPEIRFEGD